MEAKGAYDLVVYGNVRRSTPRYKELSTPKHRVWFVHGGDCGMSARTRVALAPYGTLLVREVYDGSGVWVGGLPPPVPCSPD